MYVLKSDNDQKATGSDLISTRLPTIVQLLLAYLDYEKNEEKK